MILKEHWWQLTWKVKFFCVCVPTRVCVSVSVWCYGDGVCVLNAYGNHRRYPASSLSTFFFWDKISHWVDWWSSRPSNPSASLPHNVWDIGICMATPKSIFWNRHEVKKRAIVKISALSNLDNKNKGKRLLGNKSSAWRGKMRCQGWQKGRNMNSFYNINGWTTEASERSNLWVKSISSTSYILSCYLNKMSQFHCP